MREAQGPKNQPRAGWRRWAPAAFAIVSVFAFGATPLGATPPSNDNFASPTALLPGGGSLTTDNSEATKEPGEPNHAGDEGGKSIWYTWTPSFGGSASIDTVGSAFDTL